jgi:mannose-6-phosphate isomerase-like protein (cupin superfamily)
MSYKINVIEETKRNTDFRKVLFTGAKSQLVVMEIPPGGEIGEETHDHVEQTLFILNGEGVVELDGETKSIGPGDAVVVTPGTRHNFKNTGNVPLELYTVYAPPNHIDGRVHESKVDADADTEDESFGHSV